MVAIFYSTIRPTRRTTFCMAIYSKSWRDSAGVFALVLALVSVPTFLFTRVMSVQFERSAPFDVWFANLSLLGCIAAGAFCGGFAAYHMGGGKEHHLIARIFVTGLLATAFSIVAAAALIVISMVAVGLVGGGSIRADVLILSFFLAALLGFMKGGILALCVATAWAAVYCVQASMRNNGVQRTSG